MLNNITISGRLVADPELRHTKGSEPILVVNFRIANDRNYKNNGETVTDFFHCTAWRKKAEFINEYFSKGDIITIVGSIHNNSYTDNNGIKRTDTYIDVSEAFFHSKKAATSGKSNDTFTATQDDIDNFSPEMINEEENHAINFEEYEEIDSPDFPE